MRIFKNEEALTNMKYILPFICLSVCFLSPCFGESLPPEKQQKVDPIIAIVQSWATEPLIVNAVKAQNAHLPEAIAGITPEQWDTFTVLDPVVRSMMKNEVGQFLKSKMTDAMTLALLNDAQGYKIGYVIKPKNWIHKGLPQQEQAMLGKVYQGPLVVHPATGILQLLLGVPVMDGGKPIGVIIVGVKASALE